MKIKDQVLGKKTSSKPIVVFRSRVFVVIRSFFFFFFFFFFFSIYNAYWIIFVYNNNLNMFG
ncbi:hypothetical protein ACMBCN_00840 [Candidatus Liberibacter asiaticus]|nr:hypothetical protein [Candidatus Liberibacter asiaticus]